MAKVNSANFDDDFSEAIAKATQYCSKNNLELITSDLLVLFCMKTTTQTALQQQGLKLDKLQELVDNIETYHKKNQKYIMATIEEKLAESGTEDLQIIHNSWNQARSNQKVMLSAAISRQIQTAIAISEKNQIQRIGIFAYLLGVLEDRESFVSYYLNKSGVTRAFISDKFQIKLLSPLGADATSLEKYTENITQMADLSLLNTTIGRDNEIEEIFEILGRKNKNNALLVGKAGVGKTAVVEMLAQRIVNNEIPVFLQENQILSLNLNALISGTKFRGEFEERVEQLFNDLKENKKPIILFIDEFHMIMGFGNSSNNDFSNYLKQISLQPNIKIIGATTFEEYRKFIEKDSALSRRFQKVEIPELGLEQTKNILMRLLPEYEMYHEIKYPNMLIDIIIESCAKFLPQRQFPDKAIDVMDQIGIKAKLAKKTSVSSSDIDFVISRMAKLPLQELSKSEKDKINDLYKNLQKEIFGQDEVVRLIHEAIMVSKTGLREESKTQAAFLFTGPTGVGKTEVCKVLSKTLGMPLLRFDMSEYTESHSISKLIGSPPGYVGYDKGGELTEKINEYPYAILLLDEMEKAHPQIYNIFLQMLDRGFLTDSQGREIDCRQLIVIMTSNVGAAAVQKGSIALSDSSSSHKRTNILHSTFPPEFRNRLDAIIEFSPLSHEASMKVVAKELTDLKTKLEKKNIDLIWDKEVEEFLYKKGFDKLMGARPLKRAVQNFVTKELATIILSHEKKDVLVVELNIVKHNIKAKVYG